MLNYRTENRSHAKSIQTYRYMNCKRKLWHRNYNIKSSKITKVKFYITHTVQKLQPDDD
jgi:hypothetical protein